MVRRMPEQIGESTKAQSKYRGPMVLTEILPSDVYRIANLRSQGQQRSKRLGYETTAHAAQLKLFHLINQDDNEEEMDVVDEVEDPLDEESSSTMMDTHSTPAKTSP